MNEIRPFSESISTGDDLSYKSVVEYAVAAPAPANVETAFETLRKVYRGDKKLPTRSAVIGARKILEQWKKDLLVSKKGNVAIYTRIEAALKVKHPGEIIKPFLKTVPVKMTATQKAKAEKVVSEVAKQLGQKKLAKATIVRIAGKIAPFIGIFLATWTVVNLAKNKNVQELYKKLLTSDPGFMAESKTKENIAIPHGEFYHKDKGWY